MIHRLLLLYFGIFICLGTAMPATADSASRLTLTECIELAYQNNPRVVIAKEKVKIAYTQKQQAIGTALPTLKLTSSYAKLSNPYKDFTEALAPLFSEIDPSANIDSSSGGNDQEQYKTAISLTQVLWGAHVLPVVSAADLAVKQAEQTFLREKQNMTLRVTRSFFDVLKARRLLGIAVQSGDSLSAHLHQVQTMKQVGLATEADVLQTKLQLARLQQQLVQLDGTVALAENAFNHVLGRNLTARVRLDDRTEEAVPSASYDDLLTIAMESRPDLESLQNVIHILETNLHVVGSPQWPALVLNAGYDWTSYNRFSFGQTDQNWFWTVVASWTFFDGLQTPAKVAEAESSLIQTEKSYEQLRNGIAMEVRQAWIGLNVAKRKLAVSVLEVALAQKSVEIAQTRYQHGAGSNLDVLDAQTSLVSARSGQANTNYDYEIAKATVWNAVGVMN